MNKIVGIILGIALLSLASATTIYSGENYTFSVDTTNNLVWDVVNNHSNMNGFDVYQDIFSDYSNITFSTDVRFAPDSFTIIFIDDSTKEVIKEVHHYSSGSSSTRKIYIENKTIEYVDVTIPCNETDIIDLTPEDLTPEEKSWLNKFLGWICKIFNRIFVNDIISCIGDNSLLVASKGCGYCHNQNEKTNSSNDYGNSFNNISKCNVCRRMFTS